MSGTDRSTFPEYSRGTGFTSVFTTREIYLLVDKLDCTETVFRSRLEKDFLKSFKNIQLRDLILHLRKHRNRAHLSAVGRKSELVETLRAALQSLLIERESRRQCSKPPDSLSPTSVPTSASGSAVMSSAAQTPQYGYYTQNPAMYQQPFVAARHGGDAHAQAMAQMRQAAYYGVNAPGMGYPNSGVASAEQIAAAHTQQLIQRQAAEMHERLSKVNYNLLSQDERFTNDRQRPPIHHTEKRLCTIPVYPMKRIQFEMKVPRDYVQLIQSTHSPPTTTAATSSTRTATTSSKKKRKMSCSIRESKKESVFESDSESTEDESADEAFGGKKQQPAKYELFVRLFSITYEHSDWALVECQIAIGDENVAIDKSKVKSALKAKVGLKKKGHHIVKPLCITKFAGEKMSIQITSNKAFGGVAVVEFVRVDSTGTLMRRVNGRSALPGTVAKVCAVCDVKSDLLRCSRCKAAWYCGSQHQADDWAFHQTICLKPKEKLRLKRSGDLAAAHGSGHGSGDEILCDEQRVSLRCPLALVRIGTPVRGVCCSHPQCIDLAVFLEFCGNSGNWQCPVCSKPLPFGQLAVDHEMERIIAETSDEIDFVRLFGDGTYRVVTAEEQKQIQNREREQSVIRRRKRKTPMADEPTARQRPANPAMRSTSDTSSPAPSDAAEAGATEDTAIELD